MQCYTVLSNKIYYTLYTIYYYTLKTKQYTVYNCRSLEESSLEDKVPPGYLDKEMLASLFTVDKNNPKIHTKFVKGNEIEGERDDERERDREHS